MKKLITVIFCLSLLVPAGPIAAEAVNAKTLMREFDPVVVSGRSCGLTGGPLAGYNLYAFKEDRLFPIPFQIDEKDDAGRFVLRCGRLAAVDQDTSFDDNDELVFMARDAGDKCCDPALLPPGIKACMELKITDPATMDKAWAYLTIEDGEQTRSPVDYVVYSDDPPSFATRNYSGRYDADHPVGASQYAFEQGLGGNGQDFIDRIKVRLVMGSMGVRLHRSEEDIKVKALGYLDGPVRAIAYSENVTPLVLGIPASTTRQYTYYYNHFADFALAASFPLRPGFFRAIVIDDFKDARGWIFYNSNNPDGHVIDGKTDEADRQLDRSPWTWSALSSDRQCFWSVWRAPSGCPVKASLYFNDDAAAEDPREDDPGELPGIGFDFNTGWDRLETDSLELRLLHFYTPAYERGMETRVRNVIDYPLTVTATIF